MSDEWQQFAVYSDSASAEVVAGLLRSESVPVQLVFDQPVPGLLREIRLMVPFGMLHRARRVVAEAQLSDEELSLIATSSLPPE